MPKNGDRTGKKRIIIKKIESTRLTDFQKSVLIAALSIPKGSKIPYKELARRAGHPKAYRAVGSVMAMNPFAPEVPCHRVIRSNGSLGRYSNGGTQAKARLLKEEGAI